MDLSNLRLDVDLSEAGEWVTEIPGLGDIELRVRGSNSHAFRLANVKAQRAIPHSERLEGGLISPKAADVAMGHALAEGIVLGWKNVAIDGAEIPFSKENATKLLTDPALAIFRDGVAWAADEVSRRRKGPEDDALGK